MQIIINTANIICYHIFRILLFYYSIILFRIGFFCYYDTIRFIYFYRYYIHNYTIPVYICYCLTVFNIITPYIHTKEHIFNTKVFYRDYHCSITVGPQCKTVLYTQKIIVAHTGQLHHFIITHMYFRCVTYLMQVKHIVARKCTNYSPFIKMPVFLSEILYTFFTIIFYRYAIPIFGYHLTICDLIYHTICCYILQLPIYIHPYIHHVYILYKRVITKYFMSQNVITTCYFTLCFKEKSYNFTCLKLFFTPQFSAYVSSMLVIITKYPIFIICAPFSTQHVYIFIVFLICQYQCSIMLYTLFTAYCPYHYLFIIIYIYCDTSFMPPYTTTLYNILFIFTYVLRGQCPFTKCLYSRWL
ncbi:p360 3L [African swine fever virus]|uniref:p360 3L n=1 Tax=African swine fever virus TaxID=10497 RepID=A0A894KR62_ASF|nr:p360 3L [African swine fever virus]